MRFLATLSVCNIAIIAGCTEARVAAPEVGRAFHGEFSVSVPSPEHVRAYAARLPACPIEIHPRSDMTEVGLAFASARLRIPATYRQDDESRPGFRTWTAVDGTTLTVTASKGGQFVISGPGAGDLTACALRGAGRLIPVALHHLAKGTDTLYVATVDVAVSDALWIGAGVVSPSPRGRAEALAVISTLSVVDGP